MELSPKLLLSVIWTDEFSFSLHVYVTKENNHTWATRNILDYLTKLLHSTYVTFCCGVTESFILNPFFFKDSSPPSS